MKRTTGIVVACAGLAMAASLASAGMSIGFNVNFANGTDEQKALFNRAIADWRSILAAPSGRAMKLTIAMSFDDLGADEGGNTSGFTADGNGLPSAVTMVISNNAAMFFDGTPDTADDIPGMKKDALSVMRHEIGHALGFASVAAYAGYNNCIVRNAEGGFTNMIKYSATQMATLGGAGSANDRSHLDATAHPGDLMNFTVGLGNRRAISNLDVDILKYCYGYVPEPGVASMLAMFGLVAARRRRAA